MFRSITGLIAKVAGFATPGTATRPTLRLVVPSAPQPADMPFPHPPDNRGKNVVDLQGWAVQRRDISHRARNKGAGGPSGRVLVARGGWCARVGLPEGVAARLPCGADLRLSENIMRTGTGTSRARQVIGTFRDPEATGRCVWGSFDFDAVFMEGRVDLRNVFNNSGHPGALDFAVWYMARAGGAAVFEISGVDDEGLRRARETCYGMTTSEISVAALTGDAARVAERARQRLLDKGWALRGS